MLCVRLLGRDAEFRKINSLVELRAKIGDQGSSPLFIEKVVVMSQKFRREGVGGNQTHVMGKWPCAKQKAEILLHKSASCNKDHIIIWQQRHWVAFKTHRPQFRFWGSLGISFALGKTLGTLGLGGGDRESLSYLKFTSGSGPSVGNKVVAFHYEYLPHCPKHLALAEKTLLTINQGKAHISQEILEGMWL